MSERRSLITTLKRPSLAKGSVKLSFDLIEIFLDNKKEIWVVALKFDIFAIGGLCNERAVGNG